MNNKNLTTLSDLALELGIKKSTLDFYARKRIIKPLYMLSNTGIYNKQKVIARLEQIKTMRKDGRKLKELE